MATKKILYFTAGILPTSPELAEIAKFNAVTDPQYELIVMNGSANAKYGEPNRLVPGDFVAGTVPVIYESLNEDDERVYPEINPDSIPNQALTATQAIVTHNVVMTLPVTGTYTTGIKATVVNGVITGFVLS
jgi:hypothetical protein